VRAGFIGVGRMGRPMVARLVAAGHDVYALSRSAEKRAAITELGAIAVEEMSKLAASADVVVVCVFTDDQVRHVCLDSDLLSTMSSGSALVVHTTASPATIETIAVRGATRGVAVADAPLSGSPQDAAAGKLTLFVGGADEAVARLQPVLGCYGDPVLHVGPTGAGQKVKLVSTALFTAQIGLVAEAAQLGKRLGVAESTLLAALPHGSAASRVLAMVAASGSVASFIDTVSEFVGKDVAVVRTIASELNSDLGLLDGVINAVIPLRP
jgi:2-hydroxy-3-oxopropionate reductase